MKMIFFILVFILFVGCSKKSDDSGSSLEITGAIESITAGVDAAGSGMESSKLLRSSKSINTVTPMEADLCDVHGRPQDPDGGDMTNSDAMYPFVHTYCALTVDDGETVVGGFSLVRSLICTLEKGGIQFAGEAQAITADFTDTDCWPDGGPEEELTTLDFTATGSAPASFNSHFEKGVVFTVAEIGLTFSLGANLDSDVIEFITNEVWSDGNLTSMAGTLNKTTGVLQFENRTERVRADCAEGSCGWNRHTRLYADLTMSGGEPTGVESISYGYSNINVADATDGAATTSSGYALTASGTLADGIKARYFATLNNRTVAQMKTPGQWVEDAGTGCMTEAGFNDAADCTSEDGIDIFSSSTKFALLSSPAHVAPGAWMTGFTGFNFTSVNMDTDTAY